MQHNIPQLVEQYRGAVPFGVAMAIIDHETGGTFDPTIYNYTGHGCTKKLCVGHWTGPGSRIGGGANGLYQIMSHLIGGKGYDAPSVDSLFDPETNIRAALKARNSDLNWIVKHAGSVSSVLLATLIYMAHAEGLGKVQTAVEWAKANGGLAWDVITSAPWVSSGKGKWRIYNRLSGLIAVGKRSLLWEAAKPQLLGGTLQGLRVLAGLGLMTLDGDCSGHIGCGCPLWSPDGLVVGYTRDQRRLRRDGSCVGFYDRRAN
jgi:hypothetical protein